jgi:Putative Ice-binding-like adhesive domain
VTFPPSRAPGQAGGVFLIAMMTLGIVSVICLGSYLSLASSAHEAAMRSLAWNTAIPLAEAGAEEGLSQITQNSGNFAADGWTSLGTNAYTKQRALSGGYYAVNLSGSPGSLVTITSTGYAQWSGTNCLSRTVQVIAQSASSLPKMIGLFAKNGITLVGDFTVDSYNSTNSLYSTNGQYDPAKYSDQATVATPAGFGMGGHSRVYGYVQTAPGFTVATGGGATVGDKAWVNGKSKGIESSPTNHFSASFTNAIPDVQAPFTSAATPTSDTVAGTTYNYVLNGGNYMVNNLDAGGGNTSLLVTAPSVLVVNGAVSLANVTFAPGATLDLYIGTSSLSFAPVIAGMDSSQVVTPIQFRVWGLPTCTTMDMTGGDSFTGLIYAPEADLRARGGSVYYGAITAGTFTCNGGFTLHYDVASSTATSPNLAFTILSWKEL